jgi:hypothetical protein
MWQVVGYANNVVTSIITGLHCSHAKHCRQRSVDALPQVGDDGGVGFAIIKADVVVPQRLTLGTFLRV